MRIAISSDTFPPEINGVANYVYLSAKTLAERGHEVQVFTASSASQKKLNERVGKRFKIFTVPSITSPIYSDTRIPFPTGIAFPYLVKFKPDIIHVHTPFVLGWGAVLGAKILRTPLIGTHHTFFDHYLKHVKIDFKSARRATWKYTVGFYNFCDLIVAPSLSLADEMKSHGLKKPIVALPNFVDTDFFRPASAKKKENLKKKSGIMGPTAVYLGRLSYEKSIDLVIKAFSLIHKDFPESRLILIGDGPEKYNLEQLAKKLGIDKKIIFTGFLRGNNLLKTLQTGDVFLTASKTETFCIAALEAMATGLPVISAEAKGLKELVKNNQNGFLVPPNQIGKMAAKLAELFTRKQAREKLASGARFSALNYSREGIIEELEKIYIKSIDEHRK